MNAILRQFTLPLLWVFFIVLALFSGEGLGHTTLAHFDRYYPWRGVLLVCAIITGEILLLARILRPWSYVNHWRCAVVATLVFGLLTFWELTNLHHHSYGYESLNFCITSVLTTCLLLLTVLSIRASRREAGPHSAR